MEELVLEIRDVSNGLLKDVNLEVEKGAFFIVLAPSGSGKSTLLEFICRNRVIASGQIRINGVDIYGISNFDKWKAANIGYIYEENNLIPTLNAYENVELPLLAAKMAKEERRARVLKALDSVGLKEKAAVYPKKFNMEEEQRVALARAIAIDPAIILADEPTGKLPKEQTERLMGLMGELNQKTGIAFMVASHDYSLKNAASKVLELSP
ncbi:MAG: ATP-binding cassette domain-containing protein [Deltaproteobacteria bacterium]|nr:ATP-binding cassette domain-containing protein [Deltaproteobacteria bacterium]NNK85404.1 ATP-binding cassette domain-containing protein [Desulfobacterales bacterium]